MSASSVLVGISAQIPNSIYDGQNIKLLVNSIPAGLLNADQYNLTSSDPSISFKYGFNETGLYNELSLAYNTENSPGYPVTITVTDNNDENIVYSHSITVSAYPSVSSLSLDASGISLAMGYTYTPTPTITMTTEGSPLATIVWSSSNPLIATVDPSTGLITAIKNGKAVISATITDYRNTVAKINLTVEPYQGTSSVPITGGAVTVPAIYVGKSVISVLTVVPTDAIISNTVWSSSHPSIAYVNPITGLVTGASEGSFTISASVTDSTDAVTVIESISYTCAIAIDSIVLSPASIQTIQIGESYTGSTVSIYPSNATNKNITLTSLNPDVAVASYVGGVLSILGVSNGTTSIVATSPDALGISGRIIVVVNNGLSNATNNVPATLVLGKTFQAKVLTATGTNTQPGYYATAIWKSSNTSVATVNAKGVITSVNTGTCTITMTLSGQSGSFTRSTSITVVKPVLTLLVSPASLTLAVGATANLTTSIFPTGASYSSITWSSSSPAIATVNSSGNVTAISSGSASITVTAVGDTNVVKKVPVLVGVPITGVTITMPSTVYMGTTVKPVLTLTPSGAVADFISWNPSVTEVTSPLSPNIGQITSRGVFVPSLIAPNQAGSAAGLFTVRVGNQFTTSTITASAPLINVIQPLIALEMPSVKIINRGDSGQLKVSLIPSNAAESVQLVEESTVVPSSLSGLQAWYDGADPLGTGVLPSNGVSVPTWYDKSGNANNATASSDIIATFNEGGGIHFNGNNIYGLPNGTLPSGDSSYTIIAVVKNLISGVLIGGGNSGDLNKLEINQAGVFTNSWGTSPLHLYKTIYENTTYLIYIDYTTGGYRNITVNMINANTDSPVTRSQSNTNNVIGGIPGDFSTLFQGTINEIIVLNRPLTSLERQKVEGYLTWKWGFESILPVTHPFYNSTTANIVSSFVGPSIDWFAEDMDILDVDSSGNLSTMDYGATLVTASSMNNSNISATTLVVITNIQDPGSLNRVSKIAVDSRGRVFMVQRQMNSIYLMDTNLFFLNLYFGSGTMTPGNSGDGGGVSAATLNRPYDIALDSRDQVYVLDAGNNAIRKVDSNNIVSIFYSLVHQVLPLSITIDSNDYLYVACQHELLYNVIYKINTANGIVSQNYAVYIQNTRYQPCILSMTTDSSGNLYAADGGNSAIYKIDPSGSLPLDSSGNIVPLVSSVYSVYSMVTDSANNLYYTDTSNSVIRKRSPSGNTTIVAGNGVSGYSGNGGPARNAAFGEIQGLSFGPDGTLYISDTGNYAIRKLVGDKVRHVLGIPHYTPITGGDPNDVIIERTTVQARWNTADNVITFYNPPTTRILNLIFTSTRNPASQITVYLSGDTLPANTILINTPAIMYSSNMDTNDSIFTNFLNIIPPTINTGSTISRVISIDPRNDSGQASNTETLYTTDEITIEVHQGSSSWPFPSAITSPAISSLGRTGLQVTWSGGDAPGVRYTYTLNGVTTIPDSEGNKSASFLGLTPGLTYAVVITATSFNNTKTSNVSISLDSIVTSFSGLDLWLDSSDPATLLRSGTSVSSWLDKSTELNHFQVPTTSTKPTFTSPTSGVQMIGGNLMVSTKSLALNTNSSIFYVASNTSSPPERMMKVGGYSIYYNNGILTGSYNDSISTVYSVNGGSTVTDFTQVNLVNFVSEKLESGPVTLSNNPMFFTGTIYEVIVYTTALTTAQTQAIQGYLAWKWGIQVKLPSTHPYFNRSPIPAAPTHLTFSNVSLSGFTVSWSGGLGATSYSYNLNGSDVTPSTDNGLSSNTATFTGLSSGSTYSLIVNAVTNYHTTSSKPTIVLTGLYSYDINTISDIRLWLDSADVNGTGLSPTFSSRVTSWKDKSINRHHLNQPVLAKSPILKSGYGLIFSAINKNTMLFNNNPVPLTGDISIFAVTSGSGVQESYLYNAGAGSSILMNYEGTTNISQFNVNMDNQDRKKFMTASGSPPVSPPVMLYNYTRVTNTSNIGYYFGNEVFNETSVVNPDGSSISHIGSGGDLSYFDGVIYEFIIFQRALGESERQTVEGYLAWKWGVQSNLPSTHPYYNSAP